jgi:hypothetical protein
MHVPTIKNNSTTHIKISFKHLITIAQRHMRAYVIIHTPLFL